MVGLYESPHEYHRIQKYTCSAQHTHTHIRTGTGDKRDLKTLKLLWRHALEPPIHVLSSTLRFGCLKLWSIAESFPSLENSKPSHSGKEEWVRHDIDIAMKWTQCEDTIEDKRPKIVSEAWHLALKHNEISSFRSGLSFHKQKRARVKRMVDFTLIREKYDSETFYSYRDRLNFVSELAYVCLVAKRRCTTLFVAGE